MDPVLTPPPNTHQQIDVTYILVGQAEDYRDVNVSFENWNWINGNYQDKIHQWEPD